MTLLVAFNVVTVDPGSNQVINMLGGETDKITFVRLK